MQLCRPGSFRSTYEFIVPTVNIEGHVRVEIYISLSLSPSDETRPRTPN